MTAVTTDPTPRPAPTVPPMTQPAPVAGDFPLPGKVADAPAMVVCRVCGHDNPNGARFCAECGTSLSGVPRPPAAAGAAGGMVGAAVNSVAGIVGLKGVQRFSLGDLLSEVFKRRSQDESEEHVVVGTLRTTPPIASVCTDWSKPWLFSRIFAGALLISLMFYFCFFVLNNPNAIPGLMVVGCLVVPFSAVILMYEFNNPRNISLMLVVRLFAVGGTLSLLISIVMFRVFPELHDLMSASSAGIIEEIGKLAAVVFATRKLSPVRYRYTLNGLVFGAAVGAGFAAFESAGYAFVILWKTRDAAHMVDNMLLRGWLSPFGHVIWTSIAAGALWRVKGAMSFSGTMLADWRFLRLFLVGVVAHMLWNAPFHFPYFAKHIVLGGVAWLVALSLVEDGLMQIKREQQSVAA